MKKLLQMKFMLLLCALIAGSGTMWAEEDDAHNFSQTLEQLLNNNATISSIEIAEQSYPVKKVVVSYRYNKTIENAVTVAVSVGGNNWGSQNVVGTGSNYSTLEFAGEATTGAINISFTNNTGNGTGHGTFYVNNVQLVEGGSSLTDSDFALTGAPIALSFDLYNNKEAKLVNFTTSSEGAVTVSGGEGYVTTSVSGNTITVTPTAVTPSAQTITVSQAADDTYKAGSATFTVTITDSTPGFTVTLGDDNTELTEATVGAGVTLPTRDALNGYDFEGWSTTNVTSETTTAPTIIPAGAYAPTSNITLYPVYTKKVGGGGSTHETASVTISDYATSNNWVSGSNSGPQYTEVVLNSDIKATTTGTGNNGKYYSDWRFYQTGNGNVIISTTNGELTSVTFTFTVSNSGTLKYGSSTVTNGTAVDVSGASAEFTVGNSGNATNGQVRITAISVNYDVTGTGTTYYWSSPVAAAVEIPEIDVAENPFLFSTTATITCATEGATIKYSYDGETWSDYSAPLTITETKTIYAKGVKGEDESSVAQVTATKNLAEPTVTVSGDLTLDLFDETNVSAGTLTAAVTYNDAAVDGATVTWSSNHTDIATIDASTGAVTLIATGEVTFTATYAGNDDYAGATGTKTVNVIDTKAPGMVNNPYTVAQARAAIDAGKGVTGVYVKGKVCTAGTELSGNSAMTYWISDDGTETDRLQVFLGMSFNGNGFTNLNEIQVGDEVVVNGSITLYNNSIYEFSAASRLYSLKLVAPTFNPEAGGVISGTEIVISDHHPDAKIYYTIDGDNPTTESTLYTGPITFDGNINETMNIKAITMKDGCTNSDIVAASYTIIAQVATPTFSPDGGTYTWAQNVVISCDTEGANIYYTTNGNDPTTGSTPYTSPIDVNESKTIKAIAVKEGMANSSIASAIYIMNIPSINADDVNLAYNTTEGSIGFTIANPVDGGQLTAEITEGNWLTLGTISEDAVSFTCEANMGNAGRTATVTLTYTYETNNTVTKEVTITQAKPVEIINYTLATAVVPGRHYIIASGTQDNVYVMGAQNTNNRAAVSATVENGKISIEDTNTDVYEFLINADVASGFYTIYDNNNNSKGYLYAAGGTSSNYLKTREKNEDSKSQWDITFGEGSKANIVANVTDNGARNTMRFNNGSKLFSCYSSGQQDIYLYEKDGDTGSQEVSVTIAEACNDGKDTKTYYTTYSSPFAFIIPDGLTVAEIGINNDGTLNVQDYATNAVVPANTGVMFSSATAGEKTLTLTPGGTSILGENNRLRPTGANGITAEKMEANEPEICLYYRLTMHGATENNPGKIGFWWGAADGAAFAVAKNKAYLAVPTTQAGARNGFAFGDDSTTGISNVNVNENVNGSVFDLQGRKVNKPGKGLYIVNGKKVVIK